MFSVLSKKTKFIYIYIYIYICSYVSFCGCKMGRWFFGCPAYQSGPGKDGFRIDVSMASQSSFSRSVPAASWSRNKLRCSACLIYTCLGAGASTMIGCCSWPIRARLRVTGPSGSAVGVRVWSSVWQFCVLSAIQLVSGGKRHRTSTVLHVGGNRWASSLLFKLLGRNRNQPDSR